MTQPVKTSETTVFQGYASVKKTTVAFNGVEKPFESIERGHSVAILPFDKVQQTVLLAKQFRIGAFPMQHELIELIAGMIDPGEKAIEAIVREAEEEAALTIDLAKLIDIGCYYLSPGILSETTQLYLYPCDLTPFPASYTGGNQSAGEELTIVKYDFARLKTLVETFPVSVTLTVAIQYLKSLLSL